MKIRLVSRDPGLQLLFRETLAEIGGRSWTLFAGDSGNHQPDVDLFVWDVNGDLTIPSRSDLHPEQDHIFVVERGEVAALLDGLPPTALSILLKPVNGSTLRSFLEQAAARHDMFAAAGDRGQISSLRNDRDAILQCLLQAHLKLQEYDQDRTNFLARAVHDFRAPLTAVNGYCGLLLSQQLGPLSGSQFEVLQRMQHSVKRLSRLATSMFQLSIGRRVGIRPKIEKADIEECVDQALHEIMPLADEKNIAISVNLQPPEQPLSFDPAQIEQVLLNLLDNSCKFAPKNGSISIKAFSSFWDRRSSSVRNGHLQVERRQSILQDPNFYRLEVSDSGPGVPAERLDDIFEEYTSYAGGQDRSGGGLGLAICKMIAAAHHGQIFAESRSGGVTFVFLLPLFPPDWMNRVSNPDAAGRAS